MATETTIHKYECAVRHYTTITMPTGARILHAGIQKTMHVCLWALVDKAETTTQERNIVIYDTGHPITNGLSLKYIGTVHDGPYVWHVFERN